MACCTPDEQDQPCCDCDKDDKYCIAMSHKPLLQSSARSLQLVTGVVVVVLVVVLVLIIVINVILRRHCHKGAHKYKAVPHHEGLECETDIL